MSGNASHLFAFYYSGLRVGNTSKHLLSFTHSAVWRYLEHVISIHEHKFSPIHRNENSNEQFDWSSEWRKEKTHEKGSFGWKQVYSSVTKCQNLIRRFILQLWNTQALMSKNRRYLSTRCSLNELFKLDLKVQKTKVSGHSFQEALFVSISAEQDFQSSFSTRVLQNYW